jgi:hypothetical protein
VKFCVDIYTIFKIFFYFFYFHVGCFWHVDIGLGTGTCYLKAETCGGYDEKRCELTSNGIDGGFKFMNVIFYKEIFFLILFHRLFMDTKRKMHPKEKFV